MTGFVRQGKSWGMWLMAFLLISLNAFSQTIIKFNLAEQPGFNAVPYSNRVVTVQASSPFAGNVQFLNPTDTNGLTYFTNAQVGLYNCQIKAPPGLIQFQIYVTATNLGTIDALTIPASGGSSTYPAGSVAWSIFASDQRYAFSGTSQSNLFYPLAANPSNYLTTATVPSQTNGQTSIIYSNPSTSFYPLSANPSNYLTTVSGTTATNISGGALLQVTNIAFNVYTNNASNYVTLTQFSAGTNTVGTNAQSQLNDATNKVAATAQNNLIATNTALQGQITTATNNSITSGATNLLSSVVRTNAGQFLYTNALPALTNGFVTAAITNGFQPITGLGSAAFSNSTAFILTNVFPSATNGFQLTSGLGGLAFSNASAVLQTNVLPNLTNGLVTGAVTNGLWTFTTNATTSLSNLISGVSAGGIATLNGNGTNTTLTNATLNLPTVSLFNLTNNGNIVFGSNLTNTVSGTATIDFNSILGGSSNTIFASSGNLIGNSIDGGQNNQILGVSLNFIGSGNFNFIQNGQASSIVGGRQNQILTGDDSDFIGGGQLNNISTAFYSSILGGYSNSVSTGTGGDDADAIGGGRFNTILSDNSFIGAGSSNTITIFAGKSRSSFIGSGDFNKINASDSTSVGGDFIGGGDSNLVTGVGGYSSIIGGYGNTVNGSNGVASGFNATATNGSFTFSDSSTNTPFGSTSNNQFSVRSSGGARFITGGAGLTVDGLTVNGTNLNSYLPITNGTAYALTVNSNLNIASDIAFVVTPTLISITNLAIPNGGGLYQTLTATVWSNLNNSSFTIVTNAGNLNQMSNGVTLFQVIGGNPNGTWTAVSGGGTAPSSVMGNFFNGNATLVSGVFDVSAVSEMLNFSNAFAGRGTLSWSSLTNKTLSDVPLSVHYQLTNGVLVGYFYTNQ